MGLLSASVACGALFGLLLAVFGPTWAGVAAAATAVGYMIGDLQGSSDGER